MIDERLLKNEERASFPLRALYEKYGYRPFRVSRFEEYDLYVRNKEFLVSDRVITFTDRDGRLLALKPDITLSIIKSTPDRAGSKRKVYYNESVYRPQGAEGQFREIMQMGLECIGDLDITDTFEALLMAGRSLACISESFVLDLSHMGIISGVIEECSEDEGFKRAAMGLLSSKSAHGVAELCARYGVDPAAAGKLTTLATLSGAPADVLSTLNELVTTEKEREALDELSTVCELISETDVAERVRIDFSVVNNMNYYDGVVFRGFLEGISEGILAGGEYGGLLRRMGRSGSAIGFAIYLDLLENAAPPSDEFDVDVLLVYSETTPAATVARRKEDIVRSGRSVAAYRADAVSACELRYRERMEV